MGWGLKKGVGRREEFSKDRRWSVFRLVETAQWKRESSGAEPNGAKPMKGQGGRGSGTVSARQGNLKLGKLSRAYQRHYLQTCGQDLGKHEEKCGTPVLGS